MKKGDLVVFNWLADPANKLSRFYGVKGTIAGFSRDRTKVRVILDHAKTPRSWPLKFWTGVDSTGGGAK